VTWGEYKPLLTHYLLQNEGLYFKECQILCLSSEVSQNAAFGLSMQQDVCKTAFS